MGGQRCFDQFGQNGRGRCGEVNRDAADFGGLAGRCDASDGQRGRPAAGVDIASVALGMFDIEVIVPADHQRAIGHHGEDFLVGHHACVAHHDVHGPVFQVFSQMRPGPADRVGLVPQQLQSLLLYDHEEVQQEFVRNNENSKEVTLSLEGVSCAACAWLIEKQLMREAGIISIRVNTTTHRAILAWDPEQTKLSHLLSCIHKLGYKAAPFEADAQEQHYHQTMKQYLYKLGIAGIATMQVMMLAVALYFEVFGDLDTEFRNYLRWVSLIFATPVLLYSALPFYLNAWRNLRALTLGMDVPVSIALLFAYAASVYATVTETGEVFFESISMFTFFLLLGRFLEMRARRQAAAASANLLKLVPAMATLEDGTQVAAKTLKVDDIVSVLPGESLW